METFGNVNSVVESEGGNSIPLRVVPCKKWCFVYWKQNPVETPDLERMVLINSFKEHNVEYTFGLEAAPTTGKLHYQGYIESPVKIRPIECFGWDGNICRWFKAKGKLPAQLIYTQKDKDFESTLGIAYIEEPLRLITEDMFYDWQIKLIELVKEQADNRTINWIWSDKGNTGKSQFCKYLAAKFDALYVSGKGADIKCGIANTIEETKRKPKIIVWDIPRCNDQQYIAYSSLEEIKNGIFFSGKYKSGTILMNSPHILVFSNVPPQKEKMSEDRWNIVCIDKEIDSIEKRRREKRDRILEETT